MNIIGIDGALFSSKNLNPVRTADYSSKFHFFRLVLVGLFMCPLVHVSLSALVISVFY